MEARGNDLDYGSEVQQTPDGGYVIAASSTNAGNYDFTFLKTDSTGNPTIIKVYEGPDDDVARAILQKPDGYLLAGGGTSFSLHNDAYLIRIDLSGNPVWVKTFGSPENDIFNSIQPATGNGFVLCGLTTGFFGGGLYDAYIIRTDSSGNSGCYDTSQIVPNVLPGFSQSPANFFEMPFALSVFNTTTLTSRNSTVHELCLYNSIPITQPTRFKVFPNPSDGSFNVDFENMAGEIMMDVSNMLGKKVEMNVTGDLQKRIILKNAEAGVYFLTVHQNNNKFVYKIIVY
jgi:hypothetical protein